MQRQDLNWWQARWVQYLSRFNAVWCYKPRPSMGKPDVLCKWEDHAERIEDDNKGVVVITPDKIRTTILITDEGDVLKQKIFNTTCLLSEADVQRLCKWPADNDNNNAGEGQQQCRGMANNNEAWWCPHQTMWHGGWTTMTCREGWQCIGRDNNNDTSQGQPTTCRGGTTMWGTFF